MSGIATDITQLNVELETTYIAQSHDELNLDLTSVEEVIEEVTDLYVAARITRPNLRYLTLSL